MVAFAAACCSGTLPARQVGQPPPHFDAIGDDVALYVAPGASTVRRPMTVHVKLFVLMVLQIFVWGAWLPVIFGYLPSLGFDTDQCTWILNAFTIASITAILFSTPFVDRSSAVRSSA